MTKKFSSLTTDLVATLLNYCKRKRDCTLRDGFLHAKNTLGETAYDLSLKSNRAKLKGIAWSLIQVGYLITFCS